jgi:hypothetical protein
MVHVIECLEDATAEEKSELVLFFNRALQHNPTKREANIFKLTEDISVCE